jgi:hypothetical protein
MYLCSKNQFSGRDHQHKSLAILCTMEDLSKWSLLKRFSNEMAPNPINLARQPCPAALSGSLARQPCSGSLARQAWSAALQKYIKAGRIAVFLTGEGRQFSLCFPAINKTLRFLCTNWYCLVNAGKDWSDFQSCWITYECNHSVP